MCLHPLNSLVKKISLASLLIILFLHNSQNILSLFAFLDSLLVLVRHQRQLVVHLLEGLLRLVLAPRLVLHLRVVVGQVLRVEPVRFLVLLSHLGLVRLVLQLHHRQRVLEHVDPLLQTSHLLVVLLLELLVLNLADVVQFLQIALFVSVLTADCRLEGLDLVFTLLLLLFAGVLVVGETFLL